ncbi:GINS complex subunit [Binucleata daphniae]
MSVVADLITAYTNEKNVKNILPYKNEIVTKIKKMLNYQKKYIENTKFEDAYEIIYEQDYERVAYFLQEYLKIRFKKIRKDLCVKKEYLANEEKVFLDGYIEITKKHGYFVEEEAKKIKEYVGFVVLCESKNVMMDGNEILMREGDIFVCALQDVHALLINDEIMLL